MADRGSGRTSRQLASLPDGAWFLVPHQAVASHCERLLMNMGRGRFCVKMATPDITERGVMGLRPIAWDVDHSYFDVAKPNRAQRAYDILAMAAGKAPVSGWRSL